MKTKKHGDVNMPISMFWRGVLLCASVAMLLVHRHLAERYHAANLLVVVQNGAAAALLSAGAAWARRRGGRRERQEKQEKQQFEPRGVRWLVGALRVRPLRQAHFAAMLVPAALNALQLLTSIKALAYVRVATPLVFRCAVAPLCAAVEAACMGERFSLRARAALLAGLLGALVYAMQDLDLGTAAGYLWLCGNTAAYAANNLYNKWQVVRMRDQTAAGVALIKLLLTLPVFGCYAFVWDEFPHGVYDLAELPATALAAFLCLGAAVALISLSCEWPL
jgi:drug/metabolite transporter (DMT)-like permease